jgi:hypothetical protein
MEIMFSMFSLSKVSKLYFHSQFKSHNIQTLNNKCLISTFYRRTADILVDFFFFFLDFLLALPNFLKIYYGKLIKFYELS